jgi:hypothetical protein
VTDTTAQAHEDELLPEEAAAERVPWWQRFVTGSSNDADRRRAATSSRSR